MKIKNHFFLIVSLFILCFNSVLQAEELVTISVTANHESWVYTLNEKVKFKIIVLQNGKPFNDVQVQYEIGQERMKPTISATSTLKNGEMDIDGGTMATPGFLRCRVTAVLDKAKFEGLATVAFNPTEIIPTTTLPDDFKSFWDKAIADNTKIPMDTQMELWPERCTEKVNTYKVNIQNHKIGMRVYGILCMPKAPGKYPAVLEVPGAGIRPYPGDRMQAEQGIITFQIGIHGIPVTLDSILYANLKYGALDNYMSFNLDNRDAYYYKHVYLGCLRANDFICTLPEYDGTNLAVSGGSQGGALSIVTAALDVRVKTLSCFYPALCDLNGYQNGRTGGWPHIFSKKENATKEKVETSRYYDVVNFARFIKVPGFYTFGYNDDVCPPTTVYSAYNCIKAPKTLYIAKETGHNALPEQFTKSWSFLLQQLNVKKD